MLPNKLSSNTNVVEFVKLNKVHVLGTLECKPKF